MSQGRMISKLALCFLLVSSAHMTVGGQQAPRQPAQQPAQPSVVSRYIDALQKRDFKTIIDLTASYQAEIARIKAQNPQVLWPKLVDEYSNTKVSSLSKDPGFWVNFGESTVGDPAQALRAALALLPPSSKWTISETRQGTSLSVTYVEVNYPTWQDAPLFEEAGKRGSNMLQKTILEVTSNSQRIGGIKRVPAGNVYRQDVLRILNVELGEWELRFKFSAVGGTPPFKCSVEFGQRTVQGDCDRFNAPRYLGDGPALHVSFQESFRDDSFREPPPWRAHIKITDSRGLADEVSFTAPAFPAGVGAYCWVRDPWLQRGLGHPDAGGNTLCQGVTRLAENGGEVGGPSVTQLAERITRGLNLQGGTHLILQVQVDEAVSLQADQTQSQLTTQFRERRIRYDESQKLNNTQLRVRNVAPESTAAFRDLVSSTFPDWEIAPTPGEASGYVLTMKPSTVTAIRQKTLTQSEDTIRRRTEALGLTEPFVAQYGENEIIVEMLGEGDPNHAMSVIQARGQLELRRVVDPSPYPSEAAALAAHGGVLPPETELLPRVAADASGRASVYMLDRAPIIAGRDLRSVTPLPSTDNPGTYDVAFTLSTEAARRFGPFTEQNIGRPMAIVLDGRVVSAPVIQSRIEDSVRITGRFGEQQANDLALVLRVGALPVSIRYLVKRTVGPAPTVAQVETSRLAAAGTYVSDRGSGDYRELKSDGTFSLKEGPGYRLGTYAIEGEQITFQFQSGTPHRAKISENTIVDPDGEKFMKNISTLGSGTLGPSPAQPAASNPAPASNSSGSPGNSGSQKIGQMANVIAAPKTSPFSDQGFLSFIVAEAERAGVPVWLLLGQAKVETTFGNPVNATTRDGYPFTDGTTGNAHNLFNIRPGSDWRGKILDTGRGGQFRVYESYEESVRDYLRVVSIDLYKGKTLEQFINTYFPASENGSARVEEYITSIIQIARSLGFTVDRSTVPVP